ncbi:RICIN domain-containing protein [uncultured Rubinisphaera sp.]|uniref:RICIN domain-containing protein n=1 Tax=uncultured Rubinisphaera sp. TaxID=1678686 RepID=UPI0030D86B36
MNLLDCDQKYLVSNGRCVRQDNPQVGLRSAILVAASIVLFALGNLVSAQAPEKLDGVYRIKVKQSGRLLHVNGDASGDQLASTRIQSDDDYVKFEVKSNADGTYNLRCKGNNRLLQVSQNQLVSTQPTAEGDHTKFYLEPQNDGTYKIRVKSNRNYLHLDGEGNRLLTTAIQYDDGYSRYFFQKQKAAQPAHGGTPEVDNAVTGQNLASVDVFNGNEKTGEIVEIGPRQWEWREGGNRYPWQEERRTASSVFLSSNGGYIELNVVKSGIFGSDKTFRTGDQYFLLKNPVAKAKDPMPVNPQIVEKITPKTDTWYVIQVAKTTNVIDVPRSSTENGESLGVFYSNKTPNQLFRFIPTANGYYHLMNQNSQKVLAIESASRNTGMQVVQFDIGPGGNDQFQLQSAKQGKQFHLVAKHSGKPIEVKNGALIQGDQLASAARFELVEAGKVQRDSPLQVEPVNPRGDMADGSKVDGTNVVSFEVWFEGTKEIKKPDGTRYRLEDRKREKVSEKSLLWYEENGFWRQDRLWLPPKDRTDQFKYTVLRRNKDELWLQEQGSDTGFLANFKTGAWYRIYQGKIHGQEPDYLIKNAETGFTLTPDEPTRIIKFDPEWYDTPDQNFKSMASIERGTDPGTVKEDVPNSLQNFVPYRFDTMHPYLLYQTGVQKRQIFESPKEYYYEDRTYPTLFFFSRHNIGGSNRSGQVFFSESDRQKAFSASASVEAGGYGVSVGLEGSYGENSGTTSSTENTSVYISSYRARYWLTLNKENVKLTQDFRNLVLTNRNPQRFLQDVGTHYPLAILYGSQAFMDQRVSETSLTKTLGNDWGAGVTASGGAFGVSAAVSANYNQSSSSAKTDTSKFESENLVVVGGESISADAGTSDRDAMPIKVVLRPIYELIRPELFPGVDENLVIAQRKKIEQALKEMFGQNPRPYIRPSGYETKNGYRTHWDKDVFGPIPSNPNAESNLRFLKQVDEIGTPILFTFHIRGLSAISGSDQIEAYDSKGRDINIVKLAEPQGSDFANKSWYCYLTLIPDVINNTYYDYGTDSTITIRGVDYTGKVKTVSFKLDQIRMQTDQRDPRAFTTYPKVRNPKVKPGLLLDYLDAYAERAFESTKAGDQNSALPKAPWESN